MMADDVSATSLLSTSVLQCPVCRKPFIRGSSHRRHISYCLKNQNRQRVRNRACQACNSAKAKCSFEPTCRRCGLKGIPCSYEKPPQEVPVVLESLGEPFVPSTDRSSLGRGSLQLVDTSHDGVGFHLPEFQLLDDIDFSGPISSSDGILVDMPSPNELRAVPEVPQITTAISPSRPRYVSGLSIDSLQTGSSVLTGLPCIVDGVHGSDLPGIRDEEGISWQLIRNRMGSLTRLQPADPVSEHNARLIMQTLRTYPYMMLRRETFPPFIHPHWHRHSAPALPWPLANCMGIANIFVSRSPETAAFLWNAVRTESQRCLDEVTGKMNGFTDECLLAAIQVQVMYLIMRLIDGATQPSELDIQLLVTFKVLCEHLKAQNDGNFVGREPYDWESWIQSESRVSRVIAVFTDMNCALTSKFHELALCSARGPWEAKTSDMWATEYAACVQTKLAGLGTIGQLIKLQGANRSYAQAQVLDSWYATADGLGALLHGVTLGLAYA